MSGKRAKQLKRELKKVLIHSLNEKQLQYASKYGIGLPVDAYRKAKRLYSRGKIDKHLMPK